MVKKTTTTVYEADDGTKFDSLEEAQAHDKVAAIVNRLGTMTGDDFDDATRLVGKILNVFNITEKRSPNRKLVDPKLEEDMDEAFDEKFDEEETA